MLYCQIPNTLIITDAANGCTNEITYDVIANTTDPTALISSSDTLGCVGGSANLDGSGSNGTGNISYQWFDAGGTPIDTTSAIDVLSAGSYTLIITDDGNGCTSSVSYTVPENTTPPPAVADVSGPLTCTDVSVSLNGQNGNGQYDVQWYDSGGTPIGTGEQQVDVSSTGTYVFVVTNPVTGCTAEVSIGVTQDIATPLAEAGPEGTITCDDGSASLNGNGSSAGADYTYAWYNTNGVLVSTNLMVDVTEAGDYTLIVTNTTNGCTSSDMTSVVPDVNLPTVVIDPPATLNCNVDNVDIVGSGSGTGTLSYNWYDAGGAGAGNLPTINVNNPGVYTLVVTNEDNGCSAEASIEVLQNISTPMPMAVTMDILTCNNSTATLDGSGSTVNGTIVYEWFEGGTSIGSGASIDVNAAGTYLLVITDSDNGCTASTTVDVPENMNIPQADATVTGLITCVDLSVNLDASNSSGNGTLNYEWFDGVTSIGSGQTIDVMSTGAYTLVVTDVDNGCTNSITVDVNDDLDAPTAIADANGVLDCVNTTVTLNGGASSGNGTISYEWLNVNGSPIGNDATVDVSAAGVYTLVITNEANGCTAETEVTVDASSEFPVVDALALNELTCLLSSAALEGSATGGGTFSYSWLDEAGDEIGTTQNIDVSTVGTYTFIATNTDNGCSSEVTVEVTKDMDVPQSNAGEEAFITCDITTVTLTGTGGGAGNLSYEWFNPGGVSIGTNPSVDVTKSGTYTFVVTNTENGCTATDQTMVSPDANLPIASAGNGGELTCINTEVILDGTGSTANGSIEYEWQDINGTALSTNDIYTVNTPGVYILLITDADNGCTATATVQVTENIVDPTAVASSSNVIDCNTISSILDGSTSTGTGTLDYEWFDNSGVSLGSNASQSVTTAGTYTLQITDQANGCTATTTVDVTADNTPPDVTAAADGILTCSNEMVELLSTASGSGITFGYSWQFPIGTEISTDANLMTSQPGNYTLVLTDQSNGCTSQISVQVDQDITDPVAVTGADQILTCDATSVTLTGNGSSTGANIIYEWTNSAGVVVSTDISATVSSPGDYILIVTNTENGCTATAMNSVTPDSNLPTAFAAVSQTLTCTVITATLNGSGSSTGGNITYDWQNNAGSSLSNDLLFDVSLPGTYTLIVTDNGNGCTSSFAVEVLEDIAEPTADPGTADILTCDIESVLLDGSNSSGNGGLLTFEWLNPGGTTISNTATVDVDAAGIYQLIVTAENGCTNMASIEVEVDAAVPVADAGVGGTIDCNISTITLGGNNTSTGVDIIYEWINEAGLTIGTTATLDIGTAGNYTLIVTNTTSSCSSEQSVEVLEDSTIPVADPGTGGLLTCETLDLILGGPNTTTGTDIIYSWTDINGFEISTALEPVVTEPGTYTLLVSNITNGCTSSNSVTIDQNTVAPFSDAGADAILTCDVTSVTLDGSASSTGADFEYQWYNASNTPLGDQLTLDVSSSGDFTLVVTNILNGCTAESSVTVTPDAALPTAIVGSGGLLTCTVLDVSLDGIASSTVSGQIEYEWINTANQTLSTTSDLTVVAPGVYTLIITDPVNGCSTTDAVEVLEDVGQPTVIPGADQILDCGTSSISLSGYATNGSNFSYEWFDPNGMSISNTANADATIAGTYTLEVINTDNGCISSATMEVIPDVNLPTANAGPDGVLTCIVNDVQLDASGSSAGANITYQWLNEQGAVIGNTATLTVSDPGLYTLVVFNSSNNCESTDEVEVTTDMLDPVSEINPVGPNSLNCEISSVVLDGSLSTPIGNVSYSWTTIDGVINGSTSSAIMEAGASGTYTLTVTNLTNGCINNTTFLVGENMVAPNVVIGNPIQLTCAITETSLDGTGSSVGPNISYAWQGPAGGISTGGTTLNPTITQPGVYTLTVLDEDNGCESTAEVTVLEDVTEPVAIANVNELLDCITESLLIDGTGSSMGANFSYSWDGPGLINGSTTLEPEVNLAGVYTLTVVNNENGCDNSTSIEVEEDESVLSALEIMTVEPECFGDLGVINVLEVIGGQAPYEFSLDGDNFGSSSFFTELDPGQYTIYVQDAIGCFYEQDVLINAVEQVVVNLATTLSIGLGEEQQLLATTNLLSFEIDTIIWSPIDSLSCLDCLNPVANPESTTTYTVTVINQNGCSETADVILVVDKDRDIYIPNAFSPNGDGINDFFTIFANNQNIERVSEFHVYNRWGEVVFENRNFLPNNEAEGWNGYFRGEPMDPDVFVYWLEVVYIDGAKVMFQGDFTLIK